eukprot:CAMPEP_0185017600 /NCGR_PEP_ID=MMETSP1103-20130426/537_1 /TAXON_ID=36769 /ORGANISM="Paraphysomonas bandaiensis, Strain Caron Lab Isolate" /LENGTH=147 /DNA_ID=CAMNT_0027547089 /DNA_START=168 /DNA_END=611 /DNA_ORIENTATION=-
MPILKRDSSAMDSSGPLQHIASQQPVQAKTDWRLFLTVEERQLIRRKISSAYETKIKSYEELLQICSAIEEELVFISAPSRLDYFKAGLQYEKRVVEKKKQLPDGSAIVAEAQSPSVCSTSTSPDMLPPSKIEGTEVRAAKRAKTLE